MNNRYEDDAILFALLGASRRLDSIVNACGGNADTETDELDANDPVVLALLGLMSLDRKLKRWIGDMLTGDVSGDSVTREIGRLMR